MPCGVRLAGPRSSSSKDAKLPAIGLRLLDGVSSTGLCLHMFEKPVREQKPSVHARGLGTSVQSITIIAH